MINIVKNGIVYMLLSEQGGVVYFGSTGQKESQRLAEHRRDYKRFVANESKSNLTSYNVLKYPDYKMIVLDEYQNITRDELVAHEGFYIENNECVNKNVAGATLKPHYIKNRVKLNRDKKKQKELKELKKIEL
jgi:hypothetical protein